MSLALNNSARPTQPTLAGESIDNLNNSNSFQSNLTKIKLIGKQYEIIANFYTISIC